MIPEPDDDKLMQELNERYKDKELEDRVSERRCWRLLIRLFILATLLLFVVSLMGDALNLYKLPSIGFLLESWQLNKDPVVRELSRAVVEIEVLKGGSRNSAGHLSTGSGFNLEPSGLIVTNRHLVEDAESIRISFAGRSERYQGTAWYWAEDADLAVVLIRGEGLPVVSLAQPGYGFSPGEEVTIIGNPLSLSRAASRGGLGEIREASFPAETTVVEIDALIHLGHSGSPVFNGSGEVIAVIFATVYGEERGLAVPVYVLYDFLQTLQPVL